MLNYDAAYSDRMCVLVAKRVIVQLRAKASVPEVPLREPEAMGTIFARVHVAPSWNVWQEPGWRNQFQQPRAAGDASARSWWSHQGAHDQGSICREDWLSHLSGKVPWAGKRRPLSTSLFPIHAYSLLFPSSAAYSHLFLKLLCLLHV